MKRILACFKVTDDFDSLMPAEWENLGTGAPDTSYVKRLLGCFDEAALENALLFGDALRALGEEVELTALTLDPGYSDHIVKNLPAIGFARVVCLESGADLRFAPEETARLLSEFIKENGPYDAVFAGQQAPPYNSGLVPYFLAARLGLHCLANVRVLAPEGGGVTVLQEADGGGTLRRRAELPLLFVVGNAERSYLRVPTLREKLATKGFAPERRAAEAGAPALAPCALERESVERSCEMIEGGTAEEQARALYDAYLKEALS